MASETVKANDKPWEKIFQSLSIPDVVAREGFIDVTATQIKAIGNREPRLMAKIDSRAQLSPIFKETGLGILAINNGTYRIARINPFLDVRPIPPTSQAEKIRFPEDRITTLDPLRLTTESQVMDAAHVSRITRKVFGEDAELTIRGRQMVDPPLSFNLDGVNFTVDGVQVETDGGYEGEKGIHLIEAKIGKPDSLNIRQLLYPEYLWRSKTTKTVHSYVLIYDAGIFRFIPVSFDANDKGTFLWPQQRLFSFFKKSDLAINLKAIPYAPTLTNSTIPFPQANDFSRVLRVLDLLAKSPQTKAELFDALAILSDKVTPRQIDYYSNCLRWMRLAKFEGNQAQLTFKGEEIAGLSFDEKMHALSEIIFSNEAFNLAVNKGISASTGALQRVGISGTTIPRRQTTISAWINYFEELDQNLPL